MQIVVFTKKSMLKILSIFIILIIVFTILKINNNSVSEIICSAETSNEFIDEIAKFTKGENKIAYLTFDDGPNVSVTPKVLDILKSEGIKATFFVIGKYVEEHPEIVKRAYEEGHYIANHGYSHNNRILYKSLESFTNEVEKTELAIEKAINVESYCSHVFRFPNGFMSKIYKREKKQAVSKLKEMGYTYIDWNCLNNDSIKKYTKNELLNNLKKSSKNKKTLIVLMHDTKDVSNSSLVLKESIDYLKSEGYEFRNFYDYINPL